MRVREWTDSDGVRAVLTEFDGDLRVSIYGKPSMVADDGTVALGVDVPGDLAEFLRGVFDVGAGQNHDPGLGTGADSGRVVG